VNARETQVSAGAVASSGTTNTGHCASRTTSWATLPIVRARSSPADCEPIAISPAPCSVAAATKAWPTFPSSQDRTSEATWTPPAAIRSTIGVTNAVASSRGSSVNLPERERRAYSRTWMTMSLSPRSEASARALSTARPARPVSSTASNIVPYVRCRRIGHGPPRQRPEHRQHEGHEPPATTSRAPAFLPQDRRAG